MKFKRIDFIIIKMSANNGTGEEEKNTNKNGLNSEKISDSVPKLLNDGFMKSITQTEKVKIIMSNKSKIKDIFMTDVFNKWTDKSKDSSFLSIKKCIGNGEEKLAKELGIITKLGGQNRISDLTHPILGEISVKDMTNDDCRLGTECKYHMNSIFANIINPFQKWSIKYQSTCEFAKKIYDSINKKYGISKTTISDGIHKRELCKSNLDKLNSLLNELKQHKLESETKWNSLNSEYIDDIILELGDKSLQELLNDCVRKEAINMTLIIVHKEKGWIIIKDTLNKITCPRITSGSPRINYS